MAVIDFDLPPAPRREDKLFRADHGDHQFANANVNYRPGNEIPYLEGYRRGAKQLAEGVCEKGSNQDFLVFPIVFLYRHHVELALKRLLELIADLAEEDLDHKCQKDLERHNIEQLWADFKRFLRTDKIKSLCGLTLPSMDIEGVDSYIQQVSVIDPDAQAFRYARNKKGEASLPETLTNINIAVFADHMERLCSLLDGIDSYLDHVRGIRDEMEGEFRAEMEAAYWSDMQADYGEYFNGY
jgi:hypothetical protein